MKKKMIAAMVLTIGLLVTGCGEQETIGTVEAEPISKETTENIEIEETTEEVKELEGLEVIQEREVVDGKMQSYLTGEWKDETVAKRRNMAVMIPNNKAALPQYGISAASVIYEAPVEGRITRLMGLFEDYDALDHIGPIRSSRDYYVYEAMAYDSIYCNWGLAVPFVAPIINTDRIDNVSQALAGIEVASPEAYGRIKRPGYATEFTGYMFIDGYKKATERLNYENEYREDRFVQAFTFADEGYRAKYETYPDATKVYPGGTESNRGGYGDAKPCFEYNPEDKLYYRSQFGEPHIDEMNGEQIAVSNVVFKLCHGEVREPSAKDYLAFRVHGEGTAYVFTNGKVIKGTWKRASDYEPNLFFDENGNEIVFNQGKTWICNIWEEYAEHMSYE